MTKAIHGSVQHGEFYHGDEATDAAGTATSTAETEGRASGRISVSGTATAAVDATAAASVAATASGTVTITTEASGRATSPVSVSGTATASTTVSGTAQSGRDASGTATIETSLTGDIVVAIIPLGVGPIVADTLVDQATPTITPGETATLQLLFSGSASIGDGLTVRRDSFREEYNRSRDYINRATQTETGSDDAQQPWFREWRESDSNLVKVTTHPSQGLQMTDFWGVVVGGADASDDATDVFETVDVDLFVLTADDSLTESQVRDRYLSEADVSIDAASGSIFAELPTDASPPTLQRGQTETLTLQFDVDAESTSYERARDLLSYADGATSTGTTQTGVPWFRELPPSVGPDSYLVKIDPSATDSVGLEPYWALVTGGSDSGPIRPQTRVVDIEAVVLVTTDEVADEATLRDALESEPL